MLSRKYYRDIAEIISDVMSRVSACVESTEEKNRHPIAVLYASKIADLVGLGGMDELEVFSRAYERCKEESRDVK